MNTAEKSKECSDIIRKFNESQPKRDSINHPQHYNRGKIEVIEFIEDQNLGFHLGNSLKYICRAGRKDKKKTVEDLEKAIWYIRRKIALWNKRHKGIALPRPNEMPQEKTQ